MPVAAEAFFIISETCDMAREKVTINFFTEGRMAGQMKKN